MVRHDLTFPSVVSSPNEWTMNASEEWTMNEIDVENAYKITKPWMKTNEPMKGQRAGNKYVKILVKPALK